MTEAEILELIKNGESITVEFKKSTNEITKDVYDTVCSFSKNPAISKVFREISLADELGSGMRNTYKYTKLYSGGMPEFIEGNVFKTMIPLTAVSVGKVGPSQSNLVTDQVTDQVTDRVGSFENGIEQEKDILQHILDFCQIERSKKGLDYNLKRWLFS